MIAIHLYAVRLFMEYLEQTGSITENPFSGLVFPGPESEPRDILSREEIILLYDRCENLRERAVLSLFYGCGLRRSEGEALNVEDVGFRAGLLYVREGKGKKRRAVPMSRQVCEDLKNYIENERYPNPGERAVIINGIGKRTRGFSFNDSVKRIVKRCGIKKAITLHCLRHSIATHLLAAGMNIEQVRNFMGHSDIDTTQVYTRVSRYQTKRL
ncbi:tyrosine-type recombinase/integrase [Candidatus Micrarchaeota archaeon]|nr:tyrosine-type recombinase/integrase [Candidatus Micrarchaeota archaeon]